MYNKMTSFHFRNAFRKGFLRRALRKTIAFSTAFAAAFTAAALSLGGLPAVSAEPYNIDGIFIPVDVLINGCILKTPVEAFLDGGTTYVPVRAIAEAVGAEVFWDEETETASVVTDKISVSFTVKSDTAPSDEAPPADAEPLPEESVPAEQTSVEEPAGTDTGAQTPSETADADDPAAEISASPAEAIAQETPAAAAETDAEPCTDENAAADAAADGKIDAADASPAETDASEVPDDGAVLRDDTLFVPVRALAEKLGFTVSWDDYYYQVLLTAPDVAIPEQAIDYTYTNDEMLLVAKVLSCECGSASFFGKIAVANVICNRVADVQFPDNVRDVIYDRRGGSVQFSIAYDGKLDRAVPSTECILAAKCALDGVATAPGCLFFQAEYVKNSWTNRNRKYALSFDGNAFFY